MGPFHRVQSFGNKVLQRGSPVMSQVLPVNLLQYWLLSSQATTPARSLLLCGLFMGSSFLQDASTCSSEESSKGCKVDICYNVDLHGM